MKERKLLDKTLDLIDDTGTLKAYNYLKLNLNKDEDWSSQVYNFLYCLAATSDMPEEALKWMEEAVIEKGLWYRPEVFKDDDLDTIRDKERFKVCVEVSDKRYEAALKDATTVFSLNDKLEDNLIVVLHGNQQNNDISREIWSDVIVPGYQIEYLQSKEMDSYNLYRWNEVGDGPKQLSNSIKVADDYHYNSKILAGFSAGCNTILKAIVDEDVIVDQVLLFSPWMPIVEESITEIIEYLKKTSIEVVINCGLSDEDCLPHCKIFEKKASELGLECTIRYIEDLGHEYPEDLSAYIKEHVSKK